MKSDEMIIDRGDGPKIKGTRITVYAVLDYVLAGWHTARIASLFNVSSDQVQAAIEYINERPIEVLKEYVRILERCERGNPPELQARIDANQVRFQEFVKQVREAKASGNADVQAMIRQYREKGGANGAGHG
ncbi:MAG TPA: hypothetical protein DDY78_00400 [Planctomycetales bacterium]|jgi:uncharacterized protein (DUF433 family)|nr:hypothetical protein [Planctomycetales bacterium]